jgi:fatty acid desaturase
LLFDPAVSHLITLGVVVTALASLAWTPSHPALWALDVAVRTYLMFLGTVMAHEASHGHMGRGRTGNLWWGRLALLPVLVPYANFRKTHPLHHAHTNDPAKDPDYFVRPRRNWEIPLRAMGMPHQWFWWLHKHQRMTGRHVRELLGDYTRALAVHLPLLIAVGPVRYLGGMAPALMLVSWLLWHPFALKTHEGWSRGAPETRSHDYHNRWLYWFSLGLSLHQAHHLHPQLSWRQLRSHLPTRVPRR